MPTPLEEFNIQVEKVCADCASADGRLLARLIQHGVTMLHSMLVQAPARAQSAPTAPPPSKDEVADVVRRTTAWVEETKRGNDAYAKRSLGFVEDVLRYYAERGRLSEKQIGSLLRTIGDYQPGYENAGRAPLPREDFTRTHGTNGAPRKAPDRTRRGRRNAPISEVVEDDLPPDAPRLLDGDGTTDEFTEPLY